MDFSVLSLVGQQIRDAEERADRVYEAVVGIVTDNKDPDKLSRVKVRFPTLPGDDTSWWAPLAAMGAGKDRGWYFLPEVDDEVLVMFAHGDIRRPVVIGAIWNGQDTPPDSNGGKNERKTIVSRAGSRIVLDDENKTITLEDGGGKGKIEIAEGGITLESSSGDVCIQAPKGELNIVADELVADGKMNLCIHAKSGMNIGGDGKVTFEAGMSLMVTGSTIDLNPGGVSAPAEVSDACEEVPTHLEGGGSAASGGSAGGSSGSGASSAAAGSSSTSTPAAAPAPSEAAAAGPPPGAAPNVEQEEPAPVVVSARWERETAKFGDSLKMLATCANASGRSATFTVRDVEASPDAKPLGTATAACGADSVEASWTAPENPDLQEVEFEVEVGDQTTKSGLCAFLVTAEGTLQWHDEPAADLPLVLITSTGEEIELTTDKSGKWRADEVPAGDYKIQFKLTPLDEDDAGGDSDNAADELE